MKYKLVKQVVHDDVLRNSFINLAIKTFDLSFKEWYKKGYWTESYIPYAFVDHNKVIANASANIIDLMWQGEPRRYIQIGTVMTATDHREKGLASQLINHILTDWQEQADGIFSSLTPQPLISILNSALNKPTNTSTPCRLRPLPGIFASWIWIKRAM